MKRSFFLMKRETERPDRHRRRRYTARPSAVGLGTTAPAPSSVPFIIGTR